MIIPHLEPIGQDGGEKVAQTGKMAHMYPPSPGEWWGCTMANCVRAQDRPPCQSQCQTAGGPSRKGCETTRHIERHRNSIGGWGKAIGFGCFCLPLQLRKKESQSSH